MKNPPILQIIYSQQSQDATKSTFKKQRVSVSLTTNLRYLTREELIERLNNDKNHKKEALRNIAKLTKTVAAFLKSRKEQL